jgi:hypothetical protein
MKIYINEHLEDGQIVTLEERTDEHNYPGFAFDFAQEYRDKFVIDNMHVTSNIHIYLKRRDAK